MRTATELDPVLSDIVAAVRAHLSPSRVILFGSRARGDHRPDSDYDILVETPQSLTFDEGWHSVADVRRARHVEIDVHLRVAGELERRAPDPGWIDRAIVTEGVLLYQDASVGTNGSPARRVRERPSEQWESVADWLRAADADMSMVDLALAKELPLWGPIAYHAQRAAEKTLKAALVMRNRVPPRTHKLTELLDELVRAGAPLGHLGADCERLEPYAIQGQYPGTGPIPGEAKGRALVESMRRIVAAARSSGSGSDR